jgi:two pore calcium channel protein 2
MLALIKNLRGFAGIIVVVYYMFALMGMELFFDKNSAHNECNKPHYNHSANNFNIVNPKAQNECGTYDNLGYYANNFNDFASSIVVLWDIMIVNNWYVFLNKFSRDSHYHEWSKLYFIMWWLVSVVICVNLFISLVLETFLVQWEAILSQEQREAREEEGGRFADSVMYETPTVNSEGQEVNDIHSLLSSQLVEPQIADIMHELQQHKDLQLV